ncbi:autotransporter outer membrane beta-barrel domain-containing protein, partial [Hyphomicrobium sulfonivorans]|nr:autotransporter outer membrane beta-barrel domain-containing protein [Hyphomicrobium sulfonivorans]NSL73130.1 autotransporter outer membrane beta-barrel domain-containing protein [Hyphomicrobium sulfonivorans]
MLLTTSLLVFVGGSGEAEAGCTTTVIVGGERYDCTDAPPDPTVAPTVIPAGNNELNISSGSFDSFEFLGNGTSITQVTGGNVSGDVISRDGVDAFTMTDGVIGGTVRQGDGIDTFTMHGGTVGAVAQGGGLDHFLMTGGTIVGTFSDGDFATITGGTIGSVDMNIGNNVFDMSGGTVIGNVIAWGNNDTFILSNGQIGGIVNMGNGDNSLTVSGGSIGGGMSTGSGVDELTWTGGVVIGTIGLGGDNDVVFIGGLGPTELGGLTLLDGGDGIDELEISNSTVTGSARFQNWETVSLTSSAHFTLDSTLVLGDAGTLTGSLSIDGTSIVYSGGVNGVITPFGVGAVSVVNAGMIDMMNGSAADSVTVIGNYIGQGGTVRLDTQLGSDGSPSDKLVIDGGAGTGTSLLSVNNVGGGGALTALNGILVVDAINGGTTVPGLFALAGPVVAGPYEYSLYRGSVDASNPNAWYLRSTLDCTFNPSAPVCGPDAPDYRPETSLYAAVPAMTLLYGRLMLDTLHERRGTAVSSYAEG